jgi:predicted acetyltransferase
MPFDVRSIRPDELPAFIDTMSTGFLDRPDTAAVAAEAEPLWDLGRAWSAFEGNRIVGTFRTWGTEITVPGGAQIPASAVTNVTVLPTHRRRGALRSMADREHRTARERGEQVALLYAAEYPIYGHFGYGPACRMGTWTLDALAARFIGPATGGIELVAPDAARTILPGLYDAWRDRQPGEIRRRDFRWDFDLGLRDTAWGKRWKGWLAVHRDPSGEPDGYVRYKAEDKWEQNLPRSIVTVEELHALNATAYEALWRFVAEVDLVAKVRAEFRPVSERLPWLLADGRHAQVSDVVDGMWLRLLDVQGALAARRYEREDRLILEVIDPEAAGGRVRVKVDGGPDGATASETTESPDLTVGVGPLSAAYLGGTRLRDAVAAGGGDEHRPRALARADALLRTADEPWCSTFF